MNNPVWIDEKGKIIEPEYCRDFLSRHPMRCINDRFYTVDGPLPDENKLKRTIYEEISPWLHAKVAQTVEQIIKALKLAAYADPLPLQCDRIFTVSLASSPNGKVDGVLLRTVLNKRSSERFLRSN